MKRGARGFADWTILALGGGLLGECVLAYRCRILPAAWMFPRWNDQIQYLTESYRAFDFRRTHGFLAALGESLANPSAQGTLHDFWTLWIFEACGPARAHALGLNLVALAAWQAVTFLAVHRILGRRDLAWLAVGLQAAVSFPWAFAPGAVTDFRLDWLATCAYGSALALALVAAFDRSWRWAGGSAAALVVVLLTRFLTAAYLAPAYAGLLLWFAVAPARRPWFLRTFLIILGAALVAAPCFWLNRQALYHYYWEGHVVGPERLLRDSGLGPWQSLTWMVREFIGSGLGPSVSLLVLMVSGLYGALSRHRRPPSDQAAPAVRKDRRLAAGITAAYTLAPALVLWLHPVKSPPPLAILIGPALWAVLLQWDAASERTPPAARRAIFAGTCTALLGIFVFTVTAPAWTPAAEADARVVNALVDYLRERADASGVESPRIAATLTSDALDAGIFNVVGYERHGTWPGLRQTLPTGLFGITADAIRQGLGQSEFILLMKREAVTYPFDRDSLAASGQSLAWCREHAVEVARFAVAGTQVAVFEHDLPAIPASVPRPDLNAMVQRSTPEPDGGTPLPPGPPLVASELHLLLPAGRPFHQRLPAGYRPVTFLAGPLPPGLSLSLDGDLTGRVGPGRTGAIRLRVTNARGSATTLLTLIPSSEAFDAGAWCPPEARAGADFALECDAIDAAGQLNFVDITDLTDSLVLARLEAALDSREIWHRRASLALRRPGVHRLNLRFVRYDPAGKQYAFTDRNLEITIVP